MEVGERRALRIAANFASIALFLALSLPGASLSAAPIRGDGTSRQKLTTPTLIAILHRAVTKAQAAIRKEYPETTDAQREAATGQRRRSLATIQGIVGKRVAVTFFVTDVGQVEGSGGYLVYGYVPWHTAIHYNRSERRDIAMANRYNEPAEKADAEQKAQPPKRQLISFFTSKTGVLKWVPGEARSFYGKIQSVQAGVLNAYLYGDCSGAYVSCAVRLHWISSNIPQFTLRPRPARGGDKYLVRLISGGSLRIVSYAKIGKSYKLIMNGASISLESSRIASITPIHRDSPAKDQARISANTDAAGIDLLSDNSPSRRGDISATPAAPVPAALAKKIRSQSYIAGAEQCRIGHYVAAMKDFRKAAAAGSGKAMNRIGGLYQNGNGVPQDYDKAMVWYRRAAAGGNGDAMLKIGQLYAAGDGEQQDNSKAITWFRKAAKSNDPKASREARKIIKKLESAGH